MLGFDRRLDHGVDLFVAGPDVLQADLAAAGVLAQHVALDVEADGAGDGIGHHQRRRGQEGLLGIGVDAAVEVAVAGQDCGRVKVAVDDFLLDDWVQRAGHAVTRGTGKGDYAEAQFFQFRRQAGFVQVQRHRLGSRRQRALHPGLAGQPGTVGVARQQAGGDDVARIAGVGAAGDGGDDHGAVGHLAGIVFHHAGDAALCQVADRQTAVRIGRAGQGAHHAGEIKAQHAFVFGVLEAVGPEARSLGVGFHQGDLFVLAAGQAQIVDGLLINREHRGGGAILGRHVRNGGAVAQRQAGGAFTVELQVGAHDFFLAQEFGQGQHDIGGGDARLRAASKFHANDVGQAHPGGAAQHDVLGFQAAHADSDHAQRIHVRGVAVGADQRVGEGHAVLRVDDGGHTLQVDLVHDPVARRHDFDVAEGLLGPVNEMEAVFVAAVFHGAVLGEGIGVVAAIFHGQRVVDDQLHRHYRIDLGGIAALVGDGVAQAGQVHQRGLAQDVVTDDPCGEPREVQVAAALDQLLQRVRQHGRIAAAHEVFRQYPRGVGQAVIGPGRNRLDGGAGVEVVQASARQGLAVVLVHASVRCRLPCAICCSMLRRDARMWRRIRISANSPSPSAMASRMR